MDALTLIPKNLFAADFKPVFKEEDFQKIPTEIHREIALFCGNDRDVIKYSLLNRDTYNAVRAEGGIWRARFAQKFDHPFKGDGDLTSEELEKEYKHRMEIIAKTVNWSGYSVKNIMTLLITLIREAYNTAPGKETSAAPEGKNMKPIFELVRKLDLLNNFGNFAPSQIRNVDLARNAVQLLLLPWTLDRSFIIWGYEDSCHYAFSQLSEEPLYDPATFEINHLYLLYTCNFFAKHCSAYDQPCLVEDPDRDPYGVPKPVTTRRPQHVSDLGILYKGLEDWSKPKLWNRVLKQGLQPFGTKWLGMAGQMDWDDLEAVWMGERIMDSGTCPSFLTQQAFDGYDIQMSDPNDTSAPTLTPFLEDCIRSLPPAGLIPGMDHAEPNLHYLPFHGRGTDGDRAKFFELVGNIYALPEQAGIPGWQHISFLKFYPHLKRGENFDWLKFRSTDEAQDQDCELWAYEGIMIPGNKVIIGRWFRPEGPRPDAGHQCWFEAGPSLMWCTDESELDREKREKKERKIKDFQKKIKIVHSTTSPNPQTLPPPSPLPKTPKMTDLAPSSLTPEKDGRLEGLEKLRDVQALIPNDLSPDDGRLPSSRGNRIKESSPFFEGRMERKEAKSHFCATVKKLPPPPLRLMNHPAPTPPSSARTPREQYFKMRDLVEVDRERNRKEERSKTVQEEKESLSKLLKEDERLSKPKNEMKETPLPTKVKFSYESDLELIKQKIAKADGRVDKAARTIQLFRHAKTKEMEENELLPKLGRFAQRGTGPRIREPLRRQIIEEFRRDWNEAMLEIEECGLDEFFDGDEAMYRAARKRVELADRRAGCSFGNDWA